MDKTIEELDLTVRAYNCLKRYGVNDVSHLVDLTEEEVSKIRNMGKSSLINIKFELAKLGLSLRNN